MEVMKTSKADPLSSF